MRSIKSYFRPAKRMRLEGKPTSSDDERLAQAETQGQKMAQEESKFLEEECKDQSDEKKVSVLVPPQISMRETHSNGAAELCNDEGELKDDRVCTEGPDCHISRSRTILDAPDLPQQYDHPGKATAASGSWKTVLYQYINGSDYKKSNVYYQNEDFIVIYDGFPKAKIHLLLIPKPSFFRINSIQELKTEDLEKLRVLHVGASAVASHLLKSNQNVSNRLLKVGYHAVPSLLPLHIHIISQDFDSDCLKNKKHWNSFTTDFFISTLEVENILINMMRKRDNSSTADYQNAGSYFQAENRDQVYYSNLLKQAMVCFCCDKDIKNIPALKQHLLTSCLCINDDSDDC